MEEILQHLVDEQSLEISPCCPTFAKHIVKLFDTDGSGGVSEKELMAGIALLSKGSADEKLRLAFKAFSNHHVITRAELYTMIKLAYERALDNLEVFYLDNETALQEILALKKNRTNKVFIFSTFSFSALCSKC